MLRFLLLAILLLPFWVRAQSDSLAFSPDHRSRESFELRFQRHTSTRAYRMTFVAVPLIVGGVAMMSYDRDFRELRNGYAEKFDRDYDDYLQYAPLGLTYLMKACGLKGRSSWGRMIVSNAFSAGLMAIAVNSLKYTVRIQRPDGSTYNSFPSGHTATAFMAATILHKEYGHRSPWFSILGYAAATATGVTRQLNNRHWMSDIMVGAGIGILTTELGYFLADLIYKDRGIYALDKLVVLDRYRKPSFLGIHVGFTTALGSYHPFEDVRADFSSGPSAGIQGAWFVTPYLGVGARIGVTNLSVTLNDEALNERLKSSSALAGLYLSYPFSARWLIGSKVLAGYEYYKRMQTVYGELGGRGGAAFGTGISMTYAANQHLGVRFATDYDVTAPVVGNSDQWVNRLTFGLEVCALF